MDIISYPQNELVKAIAVEIAVRSSENRVFSTFLPLFAEYGVLRRLCTIKLHEIKARFLDSIFKFSAIILMPHPPAPRTPSHRPL